MGTELKVQSGERSAGVESDRRFEEVDPLVLRRGDRVAVSFGVLTVRGVELVGPSVVRMVWEEDQPAVAVHRCNLVSRLVAVQAVEPRGPGVETDPRVLAVRFVEHAIEALATARRHAVVLGTELGGEWELLGRARELCRDVLGAWKRG